MVLSALFLEFPNGYNESCLAQEMVKVLDSMMFIKVLSETDLIVLGIIHDSIHHGTLNFVGMAVLKQQILDVFRFRNYKPSVYSKEAIAKHFRLVNENKFTWFDFNERPLFTYQHDHFDRLEFSLE